MKNKITIEYDTNEISEVLVSFSVTETNDLLAENWILLHGGVAHRDAGGFQVKPCFVLGRKEKK